MLLVHRAELHAALLAELPADAVIRGDALQSYSEDATSVTARFASGRTIHSDLLVGADGLHSVVRTGLLGDEEPRPSGLVAYRGVVRHGLGDRAGEFWGPGGVVGLAPLSGGRVYWYATARASAGDRGPVSQAERERLVARLAGWAEPIRSVVAATPADAVLRHPLEDRRPQRGWSSGRVTLVGDAAHPMLPFLGQGACQALEDAVSLPAVLMGADGLADGLQAYERVRHARTAPLVKRARSAGRVAHLTHRWQRDLRDALVRRASPGMRRRQLDAVLVSD
jgi:2-polyprenyl-6-methoxyphenol hydroxylase-like FAD-dependent oxidoreductase